MSPFVQVFGRRHDESVRVLMRPATEKARNHGVGYTKGAAHSMRTERMEFADGIIQRDGVHQFLASKDSAAN